MRRIRILAAAVLLIAAFQVVTALPAGADARPFLQLPVACGERWQLSNPGPGDYPISLYPVEGPDTGRPVLASATGVAWDKEYTSAYGWQVRIDHGGGWSTLYQRLQEGSIPVDEGEWVRQGQLVGRTGTNPTPLRYTLQRWNGGWETTRAYFNGVPSQIIDEGTREFLTSNNCGSRVVTGGNGYLYRVRTNGTLLGYRHTGWTTGSTSWDEFGLMGDSWEGFVHVVADNNIVYGINPQGDLRWYERNLANNTWVTGSGDTVGVGWYFNRVIGAGNGVFYAITDGGDLKWYKRTYPGTNQVGWHPNSGTTIGTGWQNFQHVTSQDGAIYAVDKDFNLRWYRFPGYPTGTGEFAPGSGRIIGTDWGFSAIGAVGGGVIHATGFDGKLYWYKHLDPTGGAADWAPRKQVGSGWL